MHDKGDHILYNGKIIECTRAMEGEDNFSMIFTDQPIPKHVDHFYFEVTVEDEGENGLIGVGLAEPSARGNKVMIEYWANGGVYHRGEGQTTCVTYGKGDIVGCIMKKIMIDNHQYVFVNFFKNGKNVMASRYLDEGEYYPTI